MCPCVLFDKLKNAIGIRKRKSKKKTSDDSRSSGSSRNEVPSSTSPPESPADKKKEKSASLPVKSPGSEINSVEGKVKKLEDVQMKVELIGQIVEKKANPANFGLHVLQAERPDLVPTDDAKLKPEEVKTLDDYLLRKGEMRGGISITLGKVVDCDSSLRVGEGEDVTVVMLYAHGRFGAIYLVHREANNEQERRGLGNGMALKTSRRMYASARIEQEIRVLSHLCTLDRSKGPLKGVAPPTHITPMFFHGTAAGTPYLVMPMMDANLEKMRQELTSRLPPVDAFYIGQEALLAVRQCHDHRICHRDVKPTNLVLSTQHNRSWWLCDFGDACAIGERRKLSPPDAHTLVFLSRSAHAAIGADSKVAATVEMDIESWFYLLVDLFIPLPWRETTEIAETLASKRRFWSSLDTSLNDAPPQLSQLAKIIAAWHEEEGRNEKRYGELTACLRDGFTKYNETPPWKPSWLTRRPCAPNAPNAPNAPSGAQKSQAAKSSQQAPTTTKKGVEKKSKSQKSGQKKKKKEGEKEKKKTSI